MSLDISCTCDVIAIAWLMVLKRKGVMSRVSFSLPVTTLIPRP
jgi:hypothetical protein